MFILGLSAFYHDSAACLLKDGEIIAAAQEERFSRKKFDASFPYESIKYVLSEANIKLNEVDFIVFHEKPFLKFERLLETYIAFAPYGFRSFIASIPIWLREKLFQKKFIFESLKKTFKLLFAKRISINALIVTTFFSIILIFSVSNKINIPYIDFLKNLDEEELIININSKVRGEAAYPEWTKINSKSELIYKIPIRTIYFLFSPFPWKITKVEHTIGVLDAFLYTVLAYLIFLNRRTILKDPTLRTLLIIALFYCATFGLGVGNFGTAIRHRSKLVILLILLAAPLIPKLKFFIKKEIVEKIKKLKKA